MSDEYSIKKKHSITKYSVSHLSNNTPHIQFKIQKEKLVSGKSPYGLALRVLSCMQKRPKDSYFLPSSQT
jgi:hypothetical protein